MDPLTGWLPNQLGHTGISSSPRRESNSSLLFTKQLHDRRATRAIWSRRRDSNPRLPRWQRSALPLSYACKEFPSRLSTARWMSCASHRSVGDRAITGRASRAPVHLVEARGIEPPIPASQTPCLTVRPHLVMISPCSPHSVSYPCGCSVVVTETDRGSPGNRTLISRLRAECITVMLATQVVGSFLGTRPDHVAVTIR